MNQFAESHCPFFNANNRLGISRKRAKFVNIRKSDSIQIILITESDIKNFPIIYIFFHYIIFFILYYSSYPMNTFRDFISATVIKENLSFVNV